MNFIEAIKAAKEDSKVKRKEWTIYYKVSKSEHLIDIYDCCDNSLLELHKTFIDINNVLANDWEVIE